MIDADLGRAVLSLETDKRPLNRGFSDAKRDAEEFTKSVGLSMQQAGQTLSRAGRTMTTNITLPVLAAGAAIFKVGKDFDQTLNQIVGLTDITREEIGGIRSEILAMGEAVGKTPQELAEALYFVASAGFDAKDAMAVLETAARASASGLGTTQDIAKVLGLTINAYGKDNITAARAADILTEAIAQGTAEADAFASVLGRVVPMAAQMGVGFDEVAAALAGMTLTGLSADEAATSLNQVLVSMLKPTREAEQALNDMGLSSAELRKQLREEGLLSVLRSLEEQFGNNDEAAAKVFGNVRALRGALALLGLDAEQLDAIFAKVTDSEGRLAEGFAETEGPARDLDRAISRMQTTLIELGADVLPVVVDVLAAAGGVLREFTGWWKTLDPGMRRNIVTFGLLAAAIGPVLVVIGKVMTAVGLLSRGMGAARTAIMGFFQDLALGRSLSASLFGEGGLFGGLAKTLGRLPGSGLVRSAAIRAGAAIAVPFRLAFAAMDKLATVLSTTLSRLASTTVVTNALDIAGRAAGTRFGMGFGLGLGAGLVVAIPAAILWAATNARGAISEAWKAILPDDWDRLIDEANAKIPSSSLIPDPDRLAGKKFFWELIGQPAEASMTQVRESVTRAMSDLGNFPGKVKDDLSLAASNAKGPAGETGDSIKTIGQKASAAALRVVTAMQTIVSSILGARETLISGAQEDADAIWDPEIAKLELVTLKHELAAERRKLAEEDLTKAEKAQTELRIAQLEQQLFVQRNVVASFEDDRAQLEREKGNLRRVTAALNEEGISDDQRTILEERATAHRLNIDSMERQAAAGGTDIREGFIGPLAKMPGKTGKIGRDTRTELKSPLNKLADEAWTIGDRTGDRYSRALRLSLSGATQAARDSAAIIGRILRQESPAKEGPFSEGGGMEGWAWRAGTDYTRAMGESLRRGVAHIRSAVGGIGDVFRLGMPGPLNLGLAGITGSAMAAPVDVARPLAAAARSTPQHVHYHSEQKVEVRGALPVRTHRQLVGEMQRIEKLRTLPNRTAPAMYPYDEGERR